MISFSLLQDTKFSRAHWLLSSSWKIKHLLFLHYAKFKLSKTKNVRKMNQLRARQISKSCLFSLNIITVAKILDITFLINRIFFREKDIIMVPTIFNVYQLTILFTCWQYCLPADNIVYLLTILFTCWQYCLPADNIVDLLTILFTCWQ